MSPRLLALLTARGWRTADYADGHAALKATDPLWRCGNPYFGRITAVYITQGRS